MNNIVLVDNMGRHAKTSPLGPAQDLGSTSSALFCTSLSLLVLVLLTSCDNSRDEHRVKDLVLAPGERATCGEYQIEATSTLERTISWDGATRSLTLWPREAEWDGHFGAYYPGPGNHWTEHNGVSRCVYDESVVRFPDRKTAVEWLSRFPWFDGDLVDGKTYCASKVVPIRNQLNIWLYKIEIQNELQERQE